MTSSAAPVSASSSPSVGGGRARSLSNDTGDRQGPLLALDDTLLGNLSRACQEGYGVAFQLTR